MVIYMSNRKSLKSWIIIVIIVNALLISLTVISIENLLLNLILIIWTNMMIYCLANISERGQIMVFLIAFFMFLIGRQLLEAYGLHTIESEFSDEITFFAEKLILISLASFSFFTLIFNKLNLKLTAGTSSKKYRNENLDYNCHYYQAIRKYSKIGFYLTYAFGLYTIFQVVLFVIKNGYLMFYSSYVSHTPYVIEKLGELSVLFFWIYLAT